MSRKARLVAIGLLVFTLALGVLPTVGANTLVEVGGTAMVATTEGDTLAVREGPGLGFGILTRLSAGTLVSVQAGPVNAEGIAWYQIAFDGLTGWSSGEYLLPPTTTSAEGTRYVGGTDGWGLWLRDAPGFESQILTLIPDGGAVTLLGTATHAAGIDWLLVRYSGMTGWVAAGYLNGTPTTQSGTPRVAIPPAVAERREEIFAGGRAIVTGADGQDVRIRDGIGVEAPIFGFVPEGSIVSIVNGPQWDSNGAAWYGIDYDGIQGWIFGSYLGGTTAEASVRSGASIYDPVRGEAIVAEALQYVGVPYIWGGASPSGWDCSGMIQWLYATVAGVWLPRVSQDQFYVGTPLRRDEIQPGDIIFFADTDGPGITHNGIAIGGGRFIHARDEASGTIISNLSDPLAVEHYAGARRP